MWIENLILFSLLGFAISLGVYFFRLFYTTRDDRQLKSFITSDLMQKHPDVAIAMIQSQMKSLLEPEFQVNPAHPRLKSLDSAYGEAPEQLKQNSKEKN